MQQRKNKCNFATVRGFKFMKRIETSAISLMACLSLGMLAVSCSGEQKESSEKEGVETVLPDSPPEVTVMELKSQTFHHELVSNGKITASNYVDLNFRSNTERIAHIYVKNGDHVSAGQRLADLDTFTLQNKVTQAESSLSQANLELKDVLIGQGYNPDKMNSIPAEVMKLAQVKSGYDKCKQELELAKFELQHATLTAPMSGVVANLFTKAQNQPSASEPFCRIINNSAMEVEFTVLESELSLVKQGDQVDIVPYAAPENTCKGTISEINPVVDENGMVTVKAKVAGNSGLFDGMNVRISVKRDVPGQLVVPKTAIVLRSGRQVLFTLKDGMAQWKYVTTSLENMTEYTVTGDDLQEGQQVIITGNVNLAHETKVKVVK